MLLRFLELVKMRTCTTNVAFIPFGRRSRFVVNMDTSQFEFFFQIEIVVDSSVSRRSE